MAGSDGIASFLLPQLRPRACEHVTSLFADSRRHGLIVMFKYFHHPNFIFQKHALTAPLLTGAIGSSFSLIASNEQPCPFHAISSFPGLFAGTERMSQSLPYHARYSLQASRETANKTTAAELPRDGLAPPS
jgi:hypothetical protein